MWGKVEKLTEAESAELQDCEAAMAVVSQSFVTVGMALARIKKSQLYRAQYNGFEDYCRLRWGYGARQAYYLMAAAQAVHCLRTIVHTAPPENESQLRPLMGLSDEQMQMAWQFAVAMADGRRVSAQMVRKAVRQIQPRSNRRISKLSGKEFRHYYYSDQWQIIEERTGRNANADRRFFGGVRGKPVPAEFTVDQA